MKKKENPKVKNRWYNAILYKDDPNFEEYFETILAKFYYVTYIDHNRDLLEDGTPKKEHRHVLFYVGDNARHVKSVAEEIGIKENYLEGCNKTKFLLYLIHYNAPTKTLYSVEEVHGLLKDELEEAIKKQTSEYQRFNQLKKVLEEERPRSTWELFTICLKTKNLDLLKKYQLILTKIVDEEKRCRL